MVCKRKFYTSKFRLVGYARLPEGATDPFRLVDGADSNRAPVQ